MHPTDDDDLRRLFKEARLAAEKGAPPFRRVLERRARRRPAPRWTARAVTGAAAAAAVVVLTLAIRLLRPASPISTLRIEDWKPATDVLLEDSLPNFFDKAPVLAAPVPDYAPLLARENGHSKRNEVKEKGTKS